MSKWRRFKLLKPENEEKLEVMLDKKGMTRDDLLFIFSTLELRKGPYIEISEKYIIDIEGNFVTWKCRKPFTEKEKEVRISRFENIDNAVINLKTLSDNDITNDLSDTDYLKLLLSVAVDKWKGSDNK